MALELRQVKTAITGGRKAHIHSAGSNSQATAGYRSVTEQQSCPEEAGAAEGGSTRLGTGENSKYMMLSEQNPLST